MHPGPALVRALAVLTALTACCAAVGTSEAPGAARWAEPGAAGRVRATLGLRKQMRGLQQVIVPTTEDETLLDAARKGDLAGVRVALTAGADIDARTSTGLTPLIEASLRGFVDIVTELLTLGANTEARTSSGFTALLVAAQEGHREVAEALIRAGADLEARNTGDQVTPLIKATENGRFVVVQLLMQAGASPEAEDSEGETALFKVSAHPNTTFLVDNMIQRGADPNHASADNSTPLHYAAFFGNADNVKVLLDRNASIDAVNTAGERPVDEVCRCRENDGMEDFLMCPRGACGGDKDTEELKELLAIAVQSEVEANEDLFEATRNGDIDGVTAALDDGADVEGRSPDGYTPLILASFLDEEPVVKVLLRAGAEVDARDMLGFTALKAAAQQGNLGVVRLLIAADADVSSQSKDGATSLIKASEGGHLKVVKTLLKAGAKVDGCCTLDGGTAVTVAAETNQADVVSLLIARGADVSAVTAGGQTALFKTSAHLGTSGMVEELVEAGADVNHRDGVNDTALGYAAFFGNRENAEILLQLGADPSVVNTAGEVAGDMVCGCSANDGLEGFLQCPEGACSGGRKKKKIEKLLREAVVEAEAKESNRGKKG